ncbi:hypothetical protein [Leptospira sp. 'Mane']|uniref:hypothetical protein n=1 Tax=Leptospira sp. 'Mane' TaxID=3387407 RepID=UPI00398BAF26
MSLALQEKINHNSFLRLSVDERVSTITKNRQIIQKLMKDVLREGEHYGNIPGTDKPTLLKPGAENLCFTFRLCPRIQDQIRDLGNGHREVISTCSIYSVESGDLLASVSGSCSTMESKYRYRGNGFQVTGEPIPQDSREMKSEYRKKGYGMKNINGEWYWVRYTGGKLENPDLADTWNTVLKIAQKRALIAAVLVSLAVSDMYNQDLDDMDLADSQEGKTNKKTDEPKSDHQQEKSGFNPMKDKIELLVSIMKIGKSSKLSKEEKMEKFNLYISVLNSKRELYESVDRLDLFDEGHSAIQKELVGLESKSGSEENNT